MAKIEDSTGDLHRFRTLVFGREVGWQDLGIVDAVVDPDR